MEGSNITNLNSLNQFPETNSRWSLYSKFLLLHLVNFKAEWSCYISCEKLPETNSKSPWKMGIPKGNEKVFQPFIFRCKLLVSGRVTLSTKIIGKPLSGWWLVSTHLKNMLVKMRIFPKVRGENKKYLSCHHLVLHLLSFWLNIELTSGCASHWRYLFSTYTTVISIIYPFFRFKASPRHTRLKSRKTRKARIIRSKPKGPGRGTWNTSWKMGRKPKPRFFV